MFRRSSRPIATLCVVTSMACATTGQTSSTTPSTQAQVSTGETAVGANPLQGTSWILESIGGGSAVGTTQATLQFGDSGKVAGNGSCNRFFGTSRVNGESISFGSLGSTKMACMDTAVAKQETTYLQLLQGAERYKLEAGTLYIYSKGSTQPLRFRKP